MEFSHLDNPLTRKFFANFRHRDQLSPVDKVPLWEMGVPIARFNGRVWGNVPSGSRLYLQM